MRIADLSPIEKRALLERLLRERVADTTKRQPLSYGQKALWFISQLPPTSSAYNLSFAARVRSSLDAPALRRALQALVDRHEALRATFGAAAGIPYQEVHSRVEAAFEVEELAGSTSDQVRSRCEVKVREPFDLQRGPLMRCLLYQIHGQESVLLLIAHHLVGDFWSLVVIL